MGSVQFGRLMVQTPVKDWKFTPVASLVSVNA